VTEPSTERPYIGGQALIEGVMMRSPKGVAIAVRRPDGSIAVKDERLPSETSGLRKVPLLRGVMQLGEAFSLGYRALQFSAEQQMTEEEKKAAGGPAYRESTASPAPNGEARKAASTGMSLAGLLSIAVAMGLFIALPQGLSTGVFALLGIPVELGSWQFHALTGVFKLIVITSYLVLVSLLPDMRRVFQYHGAEHKTIFAWEAGQELTVANVKAQSTLHPRCGTTFLITVVIVSVVLGAVLVPLVFPTAAGVTGQITVLAFRLSLLPLIAAISYELQRFSAKYCTKGPLRVVLYPGFLFQKITTREPDDAQIEVAIAAMEGAVVRERENEAAERFRTFSSFDEAHAALATR
jgi:uncharacterized protein YqhQ